MAERTVLVTGASGFIGSHLVEELRARGRRVRALVRESSRLDALPPGTEIVRGDVTRPASLPAAVAGIGAVYHVAGLISTLKPGEFHRVNVTGAGSLARAVAKGAPECRRFVLVSSLAATGPARRGRPAREDDPPAPVSQYGRSKLAGEAAVFAAAGPVPVTVIRPPIIYGPRDRGLLTLFELALRGLTPVFRPEKYYSVCHVRDLARGIADAAEAAAAGGRVYHLAEGRAWAADALLGEIGRIVGGRLRRVRIPEAILRLVAPAADRVRADLGMGGRAFADKIREVLPRFWIADVTRARRELGFSTRVGLREGLRETAEFYRAAGWLGGEGPARGGSRAAVG